MIKPVIAFTYSSFQSIFVRFAIKLAILISGGKPLGVVKQNVEDLPDFNGLILGGGVDIHPNRYHGEPKVNYRYDLDRDNMEYQLLEKALAQNKPVLGICRGCQLINVYRNGTLYDDIRKIDDITHYPSHLLGYMFYRKTIDIYPESILFKCIGSNSAKVNSIHKQCINKLGKDFIVTAAEKNNIIQCIEDPNHSFVIGVQFHPEFLIYNKSFRNIFQQLIKEASIITAEN